MSSSGADLTKFNFPGGFPTSKDLAPSVVFLICYVIATPLMLWRLFGKSSRTVVLIRPAIFLLARYVMLVMRAIMSKNSYGESELIAELIVVSIGTLFLVEPAVELWRRTVRTATPMDQAPGWVRLLSTGLKLGVLAAIITAIVSSSSISSAIDNPDKLSTVMTLKKASALITVGVVVILIGASILTHIEFGLAIRNTAFIIFCGLCLAVISVYRAIQAFNTDPNSHIKEPVVFWICQMVFELFVFLALLSVKIPDWFPSEKTQKQKEEQDQYAMNSQTPLNRSEPNPRQSQQQQRQQQPTVYEAQSRHGASYGYPPRHNEGRYAEAEAGYGASYGNASGPGVGRGGDNVFQTINQYRPSNLIRNAIKK